METNLKIKIIGIEDVEKCKFKPEPHTVALKDKGCWWALLLNGEIVSVVCVSDKHGGKYYSEVFTPVEHRNRGYSTKLIRFLANKIYKNYYQIAHCLKASVNVFDRAGFRLKTIRRFKHGNQFFMEKLKDGETEN